MEWVRYLAKISVDATEPLPGTDSPIVVKITLTSSHEDRQKAVDLIRQTLADGRCVCVESCHLQGSYQWTLDVLSQLRGCPHAPVDWHGTSWFTMLLTIVHLFRSL